MENILETNALTKRYGGVTVVNGVSLAVPKSSVYGFIGPNGAGKTTTMKMLLGLAKASSGSIRMMGMEMNEGNRLTLLRQTGSLIESPSCYGHLTARENLRIVTRLKDVPEKDIERVLRIVHLDKEQRKVRAYSLGMRQRLGIAQAMLGQPRLLILDEPTNGLDPEGIHEMRDMLRSLPRETGTTVLVSSHLLGEMELFVDHVGIIDHGRLLWQGPLSRLQAERGGEVIVTRRSRTLEEIFLELIREREEEKRA